MDHSAKQCALYGCNRSVAAIQPTLDGLFTGANPLPLIVTVTIDGEEKEYKVCNFHYEMFEVIPPSLYSLGYTHNGEPEMRLHPAAVTPPA